MSDTNADGNGGVNIKPLPRKSIHIHCGNCPFLFHEKMGRYGAINDNTRHRSCSSTMAKSSVNTGQDEGRDEVDNVMSKMVEPIKHIPITKYNAGRRNSADIANNEYSSDEAENLLSKSSPAFFSSLHSSDEQQDNSYYDSNISGNTSQTNNSTYSPNRFNQENSFNQSENFILPELQNSKERSGSNLPKQLLIILSVIGAAMACTCNYNIMDLFSDNVISGNKYDELSFYNDVTSLGQKYRLSDNSLLQIKSGINTIFKKKDTGSFIFAYNSNTEHFNLLIFNNFIEEIASTAARYLRNETKSVNHIEVDTTNIKTDRELIKLYHNDVDRTGVMLVKDLNNVPSELAMAFHYYCDEYNPVVEKSAIFFTLDLATCKNVSDKKSIHNYIEQCLAKKWRTVDENKIGPLLTRVVNIVVDVTSIF